MHGKFFLIFLCLAGNAVADLKCASRPGGKNTPGYSIIRENGALPWVTKNIWHKYMSPESYGYNGLLKVRSFGRLLEQDAKTNSSASAEQFPFGRGRGSPFGRGRGMGGFTFPPRGQKYRNYDQFLRSNIDNEQDNRDFNNAPGHDHLPFRTYHTIVNETYQSDHHDKAARWPHVGPIDLRKTMKPGESLLLPMRWNNPHAAEIEVNIWIFPKKLHPVVIPVRKPTCSGEGHQDFIIRFKVPEDFGNLGAKIPGFTGCNADTKPMCTLQVYAHSVESRMYAWAFPIIIPGHNTSLTTTSEDAIQPIATDPGIDLGPGSPLRDLCMSSTDIAQDIPISVPRWAKMVSDVYTHAYMNSDYSPYSGQQHEGISKNLQASCVNKMWAANHGELGKSILPSATKERLDKLETLEERTYKRYESTANRLIKQIERAGMMKNTGKICAMGTCQQLAHCFRCAEVGSVNPNRLNTNTYIPAFQLAPQHVRAARSRIFPMFANLIQENGQVQIYLQTLKDLLPFLQPAQPYGIIYQTAVTKSTLATKYHPTKHMKRNQNGQTDGGVYAATYAIHELAESVGCPHDCLHCNNKRCNMSWDNCYQPLIKGQAATCIKGRCAACKALFGEKGGRPRAPPVPRLAAHIASDGLPGDHFEGELAENDKDGSPRIGRSPLPGEKAVPGVEPDKHMRSMQPDYPSGKMGGSLITIDETQEGQADGSLITIDEAQEGQMGGSMITMDEIEEQVAAMSKVSCSKKKKQRSNRRRRRRSGQ